MINDKRFEAAIRWVDDGKSFVICERELQNICLGKENNLFYTKQPRSFVRQLHLYGFKKINKNQFAHTHFRRNRAELLEKIKRSYPAQSNKLSSIQTQPLLSNINAANNNNNNDHDDRVDGTPVTQTVKLAAPVNDPIGSTDPIESTSTTYQNPINWYEEHNYLSVDYNSSYNEDGLSCLYLDTSVYADIGADYTL